MDSGREPALPVAALVLNGRPLWKLDATTCGPLAKKMAEYDQRVH